MQLSEPESDSGEGMGDDDFESFLSTQDTLKRLGRKPRSNLQGLFLVHLPCYLSGQNEAGRKAPWHYIKSR